MTTLAEIIAAAKKAAEGKAKAKAAEEAAKAEETRAAAIGTLTKKTKEEAKGLNAACRNLKAAAAAEEAAQEERRALLDFAGIVRPEGSPEEISPEEVAAVPNASIISAYRNNAPYYAEAAKAKAKAEARRVIVEKAKTEAAGLWHIEEAGRFTIEKVFRIPAKRQQKGLKPQALILGGYYIKGEAAGSLKKISSAEAQALIKEAKEAAERAAKAKAKAEAQAEADRKRGEAIRKEEEEAKAAERAAKKEAEAAQA